MAHLAGIDPGVTRQIAFIDMRHDSPPSSLIDVALEAIPRKIPHCSWDCTRDVFYAIGSGAGSVIFGLLAADESSTTQQTVISAGASAILGLFAIGMTIYGIKIRCRQN